MDQIKNKIRQGNANSAVPHFLDSTIIDEDRRTISSSPIQQKMDVDVHVDVDVNIRKPKKKFEDTHTRKTFWIRDELIGHINEEISADRGAMTRIVNDLLAEYFDKRTR